MRKVENLFKASASNLLEIAMLHDGRAGFTIPEYQRQYDWSEENIERLFQDTLNGFQRLSTSADANAFTFLGTLILVEEKTREAEFSGESVAIVDGQQRLTTLALFACAFCEALRRHLSEIDLPKVAPKISEWLEKETEDRLFALYECVVGSQKVAVTRTFPFPRITRRNDVRAKSKAASHYESPIGKFLEGFATYFENTDIEYVPPALGKGTDAEKLANNYRFIRELVRKINNAEWYEDTECEQFNIEWARRAQGRDLFERLPDYIKDEGEQNRAIETVIGNSELHGLIRTLMFSAYFCNCVVLTRVITEDESAAFDIFDALNTTGEPLTALETLKPRVINFEHTKSGGYAGSESERAFETISEYIDARYLETSRKQAETKELVVTFALYLEGKKLSRDLAAQRNFLRKSYEGSVRNGETSARQYITSLAEAALFRRYYWESDGIGELGRFHNTGTLDLAQLLTSLISDMKTSLALPVLLRYWNPHLKAGGEEAFVRVLKAMAAFLVIRRAATGGTAGIDSDFRRIMAPKEGPGAGRKFGLCAGTEHENTVLPPGELKEALRTLLKHKFKTLDKSGWAKNVVANPLYNQSKDLARFLILSAGHQAVPSTSEPGTWKKAGIKTSKHENQFLTYNTWKDQCYATVEHIAPDAPPGSGWATDLYENNILRNSIGNLTLLPARENSAIGNDSWTRKKKFYLALTEKSIDEQKKRVEEARAAGFRFSDRTKEILDEGNRLSLLDPLRDVDEWNSEVVLRRGKNIAELCWEMVWPWLN